MSPKLSVYRKSTGERFERYSVDVTELVASGEYTTDPNACDKPAEAAPPAAPPKASRSPLADATDDEVLAMAKDLNLDVEGKDRPAIEAAVVAQLNAKG